MKPIFEPIKPMKIIPLSTPMGSFMVGKPSDIGGRRRVSSKFPVETEKNDGPVCSVEQMSNYRENWDSIILPKVTKQLKQTGGVMHGSYSVNLQLPEEFRREAHDIDMWAKNPSARAKQMEDAIDKSVGCDIAHVKEQVIGRASKKPYTLGPPSREETPKDHFIRYTVVTQPKNDVDVDYSSFPTDRPLRTRRLKGVRHETLEAALERAHEMKYIPMRAGRAREDIRRIESFMATQKGKKK